MKNFYTYKTFFKHLIYAFVITLVMKKSGQKRINKF